MLLVVSVAAHVFPTAVVDRFVAEEQAADAGIGCSLVGVEHRANRNTRMDRAMHGVHIHIGNRRGERFATAFPHAEHGGFTDCAAPGLELFSFVLGGLLATKVRFIYLNDTLQLREIIAARLAQAMQDKPRGFLRDADLFAELDRADAFARCNQQVHRVEPFVQRHVRPLKNRSGADGEILRAGVTAVVATLACPDALTARADRTPDTVRPEARLQIESRRLRVWEQLKKLESANCDVIVHRFLQ